MMRANKRAIRGRDKDLERRILEFCRDRHGKTWPSEDVANELGISVKALARYLADLAGKGLICRIQAGRGIHISSPGITMAGEDRWYEIVKRPWHTLRDHWVEQWPSVWWGALGGALLVLLQWLIPYLHGFVFN